MWLDLSHLLKSLTLIKKEIPSQAPPTEEKEDLSVYQDITPLPNFDWKTTEPLKQRPFKAKYHLTMGPSPFPSRLQSRLPAPGVTNTSFSELIEIDKTYLARLQLRKQIMRDHREVVLQAAPDAIPAVNELYTWLTSTYLPKRFPTMFTLTETALLNRVTSESMPLTPPSDPIKALETLGENVDEDILLLLPSGDGDGYTLKVYTTSSSNHHVANATGLRRLLPIRLQHTPEILPQAARHPRTRARI